MEHHDTAHTDQYHGDGDSNCKDHSDLRMTSGLECLPCGRHGDKRGEAGERIRPTSAVVVHETAGRLT
jgi:hypothetical protein